MLFRRLFHHTSIVSFHSSKVMTANQSLLSTLRKKTGYAITNCKKALEMNNNDIEKAETWLNLQAQAQGWAKAAKLQSRSTPNGLVGIRLDTKSAVMVEVNCETDFVSKNEKFQTLVAQITETCFKKSLATVSALDTTQESSLVKLGFDSEQLGSLQLNDSKNSKLSDLLALNIGLIGENMAVRRAAALCATSLNIKFSSCTHPQQVLGESFLGKYAAVFAYEECPPSVETPELTEIIDLEKLPKQLCQHIIGMNPRTIEKSSSEEKAEKSPSEEIKEKSSSDEESALYHQEFLAYPEFTVREVMSHVGWDIKGFLRFECGESLE
ncbi:hypothetical protein DAPPUDRAFT_228533 [Daphnia pulex]|uniref:Elongation factor Ts, mitochondrial n=1 Tax=Daphnia pulex TaxID=6669 RepID=E9HEF9_DAPPU|nr:hypothetical protein DAPPUDRAFT_228533 [Daphnia pulex]|eukprot:EFX69838.1 hypothetical protein DAPPUDRAFT_228533 [Daphnia pulex]